MITSTTGILFVLSATAAFWFYVQHRTRAALFNFFPPLLLIYVFSVAFSNLGLVPTAAPLYDWMGSDLLPFFIVLLLLNVDIKLTLKVAGKGTFVMLFGSLGVVLGAPIAYFAVHGWLEPDAWKGFGALAGSWIGGTANMSAVAEGLDASGTQFGLAVLANNMVDLLWIPLMLQSKNFAKWFHRRIGISDEQVQKNMAAAERLVRNSTEPRFWDYLYLIAIGSGVAYLSGFLAALMPEFSPVLTTSTYKILIVTTIGVLLSFTAVKKIPGSHELAMACIYLFVARMGASAELTNIADQAVPFVAGAFIWIFIHGAMIVLGAKIFRVDIHMAAICSAANIGAAATAPVVAAYHNERLVPVSVLLALIGYSIGNYGAFVAAYLCSLI